MTDAPAYVILGRGRWAARMRSMLESESRSLASIAETRRAASESPWDYKSRIAASLRTSFATSPAGSRARIAWLCVPPNDDLAAMIEAALESDLHVIVEKPWTASRPATDALISLARARQRTIGVDFEYCYLKEVQNWKSNYSQRSDLSFNGRFLLDRPDHLGLLAEENLGSHLLAIRQFAAPLSTLGEIRCAYESLSERAVWLASHGATLARIDLLAAREPIVQCFIANFEAACLENAPFPLDLEFAYRVAQDSAEIRRRTAPPR